VSTISSDTTKPVQSGKSQLVKDVENLAQAYENLRIAFVRFAEALEKIGITDATY
jgi:hypothetical protein